MKKKKVECDSGNVQRVPWGVAVARWQWYRWKEDVNAVRMVPVTMWQWQYCHQKCALCISNEM
jgi:hypothetical protein